MSPTNELQHYGVLGMKWGIRKEYESQKKYKPSSVSQYATKATSFKKQEWVNDSVAYTNPNYASDSIPYSTNCGYCTIAFDLRRRGYAVEAKGNYGNDMTTEKMRLCYTNPATGKPPSVIHDSDFCSSYRGTEQYGELRKVCGGKMKLSDTSDSARMSYVVGLSSYAILNYGDGSRGAINVLFSNGGGHAMAWEVNNGEFTVYDAQTSTKMDVAQLYLYSSYVDQIMLIRLDDCEPNAQVDEFVTKSNNTEYAIPIGMRRLKKKAQSNKIKERLGGE